MPQCIWDGKEIPAGTRDGKRGPVAHLYCGPKCRTYMNQLNWLTKKRESMKAEAVAPATPPVAP